MREFRASQKLDRPARNACKSDRVNEGKVVAQDTVQNLTGRLKGGERTSLIIEGQKEKVNDVFKTITDIKSFEVKEAKNGTFHVSVESEKDIRKELARQVITKKLGLLELSSDKFTLEDIFLHLTTKEEVN